MHQYIKLPSLDKWENLGNECIGTGSPSYRLVCDDGESRQVYAIKRSELSLKWRFCVDSNGRKRLSCSRFETPEEAYQALMLSFCRTDAAL